MITAKFLRDIAEEARPALRQHRETSLFLAGLREVVAAQGGDWSSLKALLKAEIDDEEDAAGDGRRVKKILDKADWSAAYADMLGLAKMNENNFSAKTSHDLETGEILELPRTAPKSGVGSDLGETAAQSTHEAVTSGERPAQNAPRPSKRDVSTNDEPSSEVGPQAEASLAGTGTETPADREGHFSEGAANADEAVVTERRNVAAPPSLDDLEIPAFLRRPKPPPRHPSA